MFGIELRHLLVGLRDQHVGYDAQPLNRAASRRVRMRRREPYSSAGGQGDHGLHGAFTKTARTHKHCAVTILQRSGDEPPASRGTAQHSCNRNADRGQSACH